MPVIRLVLMFFLAFLISSCSAGIAPVTVAEAGDAPPTSGECPQSRKTPSAPAAYQQRTNPQAGSAQARSDGETLFQKTAKPFACQVCHGTAGNGQGDPDFESKPPARNFTCAATMKDLSDGQLFWIIENGSPNTSMPAFKGNLSETDIWSLVTYIRSLAK